MGVTMQEHTADSVFLLVISVSTMCVCTFCRQNSSLSVERLVRFLWNTTAESIESSGLDAT